MVNYRTVRFLTQQKKANTNIWASELGMAVKGRENAFDRLVKLGLIFSPNIYLFSCMLMLHILFPSIIFLFRGKSNNVANVRDRQNILHLHGKIYKLM